MILRHYGSKNYDRGKFLPIKNSWGVKPEGGLWTCSIDSEYDWKTWCKEEEWSKGSLKDFFLIKLKNTARVLKIDCLKDLEETYQKYHITANVNMAFIRSLNFEELCKDFDAIWLTEKGQWETRLGFPLNLYGWDCESVLVLNNECFEAI